MLLVREELAAGCLIRHTVHLDQSNNINLGAPGVGQVGDDKFDGYFVALCADTKVELWDGFAKGDAKADILASVDGNFKHNGANVARAEHLFEVQLRMDGPCGRVAVGQELGAEGRRSGEQGKVCEAVQVEKLLCDVVGLQVWKHGMLRRGEGSSHNGVPGTVEAGVRRLLVGRGVDLRGVLGLQGRFAGVLRGHHADGSADGGGSEDGRRGGDGVLAAGNHKRLVWDGAGHGARHIAVAWRAELARGRVCGVGIHVLSWGVLVRRELLGGEGVQRVHRVRGRGAHRFHSRRVPALGHGHGKRIAHAANVGFWRVPRVRIGRRGCCDGGNGAAGTGAVAHAGGAGAIGSDLDAILENCLAQDVSVD
eukprot:m.117589 g.117589  ORF g.117589 m.117589 type:complete len:366 (+) comp9520_c0_seq3:427-1524(+)